MRWRGKIPRISEAKSSKKDFEKLGSVGEEMRKFLEEDTHNKKNILDNFLFLLRH